MFPLPLFIPINMDSTTTLQQEKIEYTVVSFGDFSNGDNKNKNLDLYDILKRHKESYTNLTIEEDTNKIELSQDLFENPIFQNFDIHVDRSIKKSFEVKVKISSVSKYSPKIFI